ncbi:MAG: acyl-CoA thioesterase II [Gammaproteobacteria bacterium]|nr:acyl-CoA thioesterase II [Gammaproteobacteria bacterium]
MHPRLAEVIRLLDLEQIEKNLFRAFHPEGRTHRLYGGQIMAQALVAATRTVPAERVVHSLHGYFLKPGDPRTPAVIEVERLRDGGSFSTRRVRVIQHGTAIFSLDASFQKHEPGLEYALPMPDRKPPAEDKLTPAIRDATFIAWRHDHRQLMAETPQAPAQDLWFRANGILPDDMALHTALLVYESDNALLATSRLPHRGNFVRERMQVASLDHAMWFHRPARVDEWLLYSLDSPNSSGSRGLNRGSIYTAQGDLVASTVQEGLIRVR